MATAELEPVMEGRRGAVTAERGVEGLHGEEEGDVGGAETGLAETSLVLMFLLVEKTEGLEAWSIVRVRGVHGDDNE